MTSTDIRAKMRELATTVQAEHEVENLGEAMFIMLAELGEEYLTESDATNEPGFTSGSLWAMLQSTHELLETKARDYDESRPSRMLPNRPTASIARDLMETPIKATKYVTSGSPSKKELYDMVADGTLRDGMRFYDVQKRKRVTHIIEFTCKRGEYNSIRWQHISDDGTVLAGPTYAPSKLSAEIRGTIANPYDIWRTEDGRTLRNVYMEWKYGKNPAS